MVTIKFEIISWIVR